MKLKVFFINFKYLKRQYTLGGIYRHPNGNVNHFTIDLATTLRQINHNITSIITSDINIDLIKYQMDKNWDYITTLMTFGYLPYITLPTRITEYSATCIDHMFIKESQNL